jgi:hypothetical protein
MKRSDVLCDMFSLDEKRPALLGIVRQVSWDEL